MRDPASPPRNQYQGDVVVSRLTVVAVLYPFFNLVCLKLCEQGIVHPPWTMLSFLIWFPLVIACIGFALAFTSGKRPGRLWTCIGFVGLILLASAFNYYVYYQVAANV
jgi:hypothetical protein